MTDLRLKPSPLSPTCRLNRFSRVFITLFVMSLTCSSVSFSGENAIESPSIPDHEFLKFFDMDSLFQLRKTSKVMRNKIDQNSGFNSMLEFYRFFHAQLKNLKPTQLESGKYVIENGSYEALQTLFNSETRFEAENYARSEFKPVSTLENLENVTLSYKNNLEKEFQASTENENKKKKIAKAIDRTNIALSQARLLKTELINHILGYKQSIFSSKERDPYSNEYIENEGSLALASESVEAQLRLLHRGSNPESIASIATSKKVAEIILTLIPQDSSNSSVRLSILSQLLRQFQSDKEYQASLWDRIVNSSDGAKNKGLDQKYIYRTPQIISNILSSQGEFPASVNADEILARNKINSYMNQFKDNLINTLINRKQGNDTFSVERILDGISDAQFNDSKLRKVAIEVAVWRFNHPAYSPPKTLLKLVKNSSVDSLSREEWLETIRSVNNVAMNNPVYQLMIGMSINEPFAKTSPYRELARKDVLHIIGQSHRLSGDLILEAIPYFSEDFEMSNTFFKNALPIPTQDQFTSIQQFQTTLQYRENYRTQVFVKLIQNESKTSTFVDLILDHLAENIDAYINPLSVEIILSTAAARPFLSLETRARILSLLPTMGLKYETSTLNALAKATQELKEAIRAKSSAQLRDRLVSTAENAAKTAKIAHLTAEARRVKIRTLLNITLEAEDAEEAEQLSGSLQ